MYGIIVMGYTAENTGCYELLFSEIYAVQACDARKDK